MSEENKENEESKLDNNNESVDNNENQNSENESNEEIKNDNENDSDEFDPSKFSEIEKPNESNNNENDQDENQENDQENDDSNDNFSWVDDYEDESDNDSENSDDNSEEDNSLGEEDKTNKSNESENNSEDNNVISNDVIKELSKEIGLKDINSVEDLKNALKEIEEENLSLRESISVGSDNKLIGRLNNLKKKSDEDLIRMDLKQQGFTDDEIQESIDTYTDNGLLKIESKKIRSTIDKAIQKERNNSIETNKQAEAKSEQERQDGLNKLREEINGTETMFGFKMAKDEKSLKKTQEGHFKYITSGKFLEDVTKDSKNLSEAAWLWKNKEVITKAMKNGGISQGKKEILDDIQNPEVVNANRFKGPKDDDGFDPKAFTYGKS